MNWLHWWDSFVKWVQTPIGLSIISVSVSILTLAGILLKLPWKIWKLIQYFRRKLALRKRCAMFRARCYWARFHPKYSITPDSLHVEKLTNGFQLILSLHLSCRNVDDLQVLLLDCTGMRIELRGKMKGRKPLLPLTYNTGVPIWRIQPNTELTLSPYTLTYWIQSRPKLGQLASCRHIVMGTATLIATNRMSISRPLKMRGFDIHVNWEDRTNAKT